MTYFKVSSPNNNDKYDRILKAIHILQNKRDNETPEMWYSCIHGPYRMIL